MSGEIPVRSALVVGAGAVGAAVAYMIRWSDPDAVALCASGERRGRLAGDGLVVNGEKIAFRLAEERRDQPFDLVIVAVKNTQLAGAIEDMRPFVGERTLILSLLNGISSEKILASEFGAEKVPLAFIIGIDALRKGNRIDFPYAGEIRFGDALNREGAWSERVSRIAEFFGRTGLPFSVPADMERALWYKFMFNVAVNQWSAILRAPYRVFQRIPEARDLLRGAMREVLDLSGALGKGLEEGDIEAILHTIDGFGPEGRTSMLQDVDARRMTEIDAFAGEVVRLGAKLGVAVPVNRILYDAIKTIEADFPRSGYPQPDYPGSSYPGTKPDNSPEA